MSARRVLLLGVTGVQKDDASQRLREKCSAYPFNRNCVPIDFDSDYLFAPNDDGLPRESFLDSPLRVQHQYWRARWDLLWRRQLQDLTKDESSTDVFLGLHGSIIRGHFGVRTVVDIGRVAKFRPTLIVNLIADVYDMWWTTEHRARGASFRGRPTLEQLLTGRRFELLIGDQIANACEQRPRHILLAASHPVSTLLRCIYNDHAQIVYLSFPISAPRDLKRAGDGTGIAEVSDFIRRAYELQNTTDIVACVCPLGIDELPLVSCLEDVRNHNAGLDPKDKAYRKEVRFNRGSSRWDLSACWDEDERLCRQPTEGGPFPIEQVEAAGGMIHSDVSWRDFRLVEQANCVAVFNPVFRGRSRVARGVRREIDFSKTLGMSVFVYQDETHDPDHKVLLQAYPELNKDGGTMSPSPGETRMTLKESVDDLLHAVQEHCERSE